MPNLEIARKNYFNGDAVFKPDPTGNNFPEKIKKCLTFVRNVGKITPEHKGKSGPQGGEKEKSKPALSYVEGLVAR